MNKKNLILFIIIAIFASAMMVGCYFIDTSTNQYGIYSSLLKIVYIIACTIFLVIKKQHIFINNKKHTKQIVIEILILLALNMLIAIRVINRQGDFPTFSFLVISVVTTAIWEELFYRCIGSLVVLNNRHNMSGMIIISIVFALSHLMNLFGGDYLSTVVIVIFAFGFGMYLNSCYLLSGSIIFALILHFFINFSNSLFAMLSISSNLVGIFAIILYVVLSGVCIYLALHHKKMQVVD